MLSLRNGGGRRRTGDTETCSRKRERKKENEGNPARGDEMRGMNAWRMRKKKVFREESAAVSTKSRESRNADRRNADRRNQEACRENPNRGGREKKNTLGGRIRIPFDAPGPKHNAPLVHEPVTPTQDVPQSLECGESSPHVLIPFIEAQARQIWATGAPQTENQGALDIRPLGENAVPSGSKQSDPPDGKDEAPNVDVERAFNARWRLAASKSLIGRSRLGGPPDSDTCTLARGNGWRANGLCGDAGEMAFGRRI